MPKFFLPESYREKPLNIGDFITIYGEDAFHISKTLRMKVSDDMVFSDTLLYEYHTTITSVDKDSVTCSVNKIVEAKCEPPVKASVFQALVKGDKFETVIQKSVELGAYDIYPVASSRCVMKTDEKSALKKVERWNRISKEASVQSGRQIIPTVHDVISFGDAIKIMKEKDCAFICYESEENLTPKTFLQKKPKTLAFFIGPEGGISPEEIKAADDMGIPSVSLGKLILRTETAAPALLSMILYETQL